MVTRRSGWLPSLVWVIPLIAALIGVALVVKSIAEKGPTIVISFSSAEGLEPVNVDCTVIMQEPRLAPHRPAIRESLAAALGLSVRRVNVKASTGEGIGFVGRGEGVAALAVASLRTSA